MRRSCGWILICLLLPALLGSPAAAVPDSVWTAQRTALVRLLQTQGIADDGVLRAMRGVERHRFVPADARPWAYANRPLPIGLEQTISQPYIVAFMTQVLDPQPGDRVLEIGTGSGYQAAVLAALVDTVYTIEILPELTARAAAVLQATGCGNVRLRSGDGYFGWPEEAPFDGIMVTAAPDHVPPALVEQLAVGAHLVIPVGETGKVQQLLRITRQADGAVRQRLLPVRFVPMTGRAEDGP